MAITKFLVTISLIVVFSFGCSKSLGVDTIKTTGDNPKAPVLVNPALEDTLKITISKTDGDLIPGEILTVSVSDSSSVDHIGYYWDKSPLVVYNSADGISAPETPGEHTLKIYAKDSSENYSKLMTFKFTIVKQ